MLYFDEAGYTGPDLTNNIQPYFALASIRMTADEIDCMKKDIGYCEWGKELHFKSMSMLTKILWNILEIWMYQRQLWDMARVSTSILCLLAIWQSLSLTRSLEYS